LPGIADLARATDNPFTGIGRLDASTLIAFEAFTARVVSVATIKVALLGEATVVRNIGHLPTTDHTTDLFVGGAVGEAFTTAAEEAVAAIDTCARVDTPTELTFEAIITRVVIVACGDALAAFTDLTRTTDNPVTWIYWHHTAAAITDELTVTRPVSVTTLDVTLLGEAAAVRHVRSVSTTHVFTDLCVSWAIEDTATIHADLTVIAEDVGARVMGWITLTNIAAAIVLSETVIAMQVAEHLWAIHHASSITADLAFGAVDVITRISRLVTPTDLTIIVVPREAVLAEEITF
jgi:hypothetical protein